ncbi:MAG: c-type cytochrome [Comamonadaceae bacterium]
MKLTKLAASLAIAALAGFSAQTFAAVDADAAQALFKKNKCNTCHDADKAKKGPSLKSIAAKYKGKADGQAAIVKAVTTGPKVKTPDGEEEHKVLDSKDAGAQKNLADWILAQ